MKRSYIVIFLLLAITGVVFNMLPYKVSYPAAQTPVRTTKSTLLSQPATFVEGQTSHFTTNDLTRWNGAYARQISFYTPYTKPADAYDAADLIAQRPAYQQTAYQFEALPTAFTGGYSVTSAANNGSAFSKTTAEALPDMSYTLSPQPALQLTTFQAAEMPTAFVDPISTSLAANNLNTLNAPSSVRRTPPVIGGEDTPPDTPGFIPVGDAPVWLVLVFAAACAAGVYVRTHKPSTSREQV